MTSEDVYQSPEQTMDALTEEARSSTTTKRGATSGRRRTNIQTLVDKISPLFNDQKHEVSLVSVFLRYSPQKNLDSFIGALEKLEQNGFKVTGASDYQSKLYQLWTKAITPDLETAPDQTKAMAFIGVMLRYNTLLALKKLNHTS